MKVQIEVGKGIQCDGIEIMFGDSISSVVKAVGEVDKYEDNLFLRVIAFSTCRFE